MSGWMNRIGLALMAAAAAAMIAGDAFAGDPASSVTDAWSRTWDVPNLIVADGATFPNTADKNPTLTILALAWRAADHLVEEMKRGNL